MNPDEDWQEILQIAEEYAQYGEPYEDDDLELVDDTSIDLEPPY